MYEHLVFYDNECPLCNRAVRHIIAIDSENRIAFAPLKGITSATYLVGPHELLMEANSLVLIESYQSVKRRFWIRSRAILRLYWLVGGPWKLLGLLSFFPGWLGDLLYRFFALHRHQFKLKMKETAESKKRFLP